MAWEHVATIAEESGLKLSRVKRDSDGVSGTALTINGPANLTLSPKHPLNARPIDPRLPRIIDVSEVEGTTTVVYDAVAHQPLADAIHQRQLSAADGISLAITLADGIRALHRYGLQHSLLSPATVAVDRFGNPLLFGYALSAPAIEEHLASADPTHNPSAARAESSDVYGCAVISYLIATGHLPFDSRNIEHAALPPAVGKRSSNWPPEAFEILARATSPDPQKRPQTITEFRNRLARLSPVPVRAESEPIRSSIERPAPRSPWKTIALALALAAASAATFCW